MSSQQNVMLTILKKEVKKKKNIKSNWNYSRKSGSSNSIVEFEIHYLFYK